MYELVPCPRCRKGKIHYHVGFDFWTDCPTCGGSGIVKRGVIINNKYSRKLMENQSMEVH